MNVLIVEDDPITAQLLAQVLRQAGNIETTTVTTRFTDVIDNTDWESVDAIVCDQLLENFDGKDILEWIEDNYPYIRRVMLTADAQVVDSDTHAHTVLIKPAGARLLFSALGFGQ